MHWPKYYSDDIFMTLSWHIDDIFMTYSWHIHDIFKTLFNQAQQSDLAVLVALVGEKLSQRDGTKKSSLERQSQESFSSRAGTSFGRKNNPTLSPKIQSPNQKKRSRRESFLFLVECEKIFSALPTYRKVLISHWATCWLPTIISPLFSPIQCLPVVVLNSFWIDLKKIVKKKEEN